MPSIQIQDDSGYTEVAVAHAFFSCRSVDVHGISFCMYRLCSNVEDHSNVDISHTLSEGHHMADKKKQKMHPMMYDYHTISEQQRYSQRILSAKECPKKTFQNHLPPLSRSTPDNDLETDFPGPSAETCSIVNVPRKSKVLIGRHYQAEGQLVIGMLEKGPARVRNSMCSSRASLLPPIIPIPAIGHSYAEYVSSSGNGSRVNEGPLVGSTPSTYLL